MIDQIEGTYLTLNGGPNAVFEIAKTQHRSAKIVIQASSNAEHQLSEVYVMHDNKKAYIRQLDIIYTTDPFVTYTANINSNTMFLKATSTLANTDLILQADLFVASVAAADKTVDLEGIIDAATSISSLYPNDSTNYADAMTGSLSKQNDVYVLNRKINDSLEYMQTAEFNSQSASFKQKYMDDLANSINTISNTLDTSVDSDLRNYYEATKKIESMTAVSGLSAGYSDPNAKRILDRVLKPEAASIFAAKE